MSAQEVTTSYDCREPNCDQEAKSSVGQYSYCDYHRQIRAERRVEQAPVVVVTSTSTLTRFGEVARKIASLTSIRRTRSEDGVRIVVHGGPLVSLRTREEAAIARLEAVAAKLEATI